MIVMNPLFIEENRSSLEAAPKNALSHRSVSWLAFLLILSLAALLRFANLRQYPGWYSDEGVFISLSQSLTQGRWQIFSQLVSPLDVQRLPLFPLLLSLLFKAWGADILVLRFLTALCGTIDVLLLFVFVRRAAGDRLALLSAGLLAILPWAVIFNRIGFSYNLMAPLFMTAVFTIWEFTRQRKTGWAVVACIAASLAFCTDYLGAVSIGVILIVIFLYRPRRLLQAILIQALMIVLVTALPFLQNVQGNLQAIRFITDTKVSVSLPMQFINLLINTGELLHREGWIILAMAGLFMIQQPRLRGILLLATGASLLLTLRTFTPTGRGMHYLIHLFPFFSLGLAVFLDRAFSWVYKIFHEMFSVSAERIRRSFGNLFSPRTWKSMVTIAAVTSFFLVLITPILWMFFTSLGLSFSGYNFYFSENDDVGLTSANDASAVIDYVEGNFEPSGLVLASPQILWAFPENRQADWGLTASYHDPTTNNRQYAYPCSLEDVRYAIIDPLALNFVTRLSPQLDTLVKTTSAWPLVFRSGRLEVHQKPLIIDE